MSMSDIKAEWDHYLDTLLAVPTGTANSVYMTLTDLFQWAQLTKYPDSGPIQL